MQFHAQSLLEIGVLSKLVLVIQLFHIFITPDFHRRLSNLIKGDELGLVQLLASAHESSFSRLDTAIAPTGLAFDVFVIVVVLL